MTNLANTLRDEGDFDESECFIDAMFASAKGGGARSARPSAVGVSRSWALWIGTIFR
jgi:hypothetical protein